MGTLPSSELGFGIVGEGKVSVASVFHGVFLCALMVCTLGFGSLNHGIWSVIKVFCKPRVTNIKGANFFEFWGA